MAFLLTGLQEDWLLDSLEKYEGIYIFELQYPSSCLEWNQHGSSVWLATMSGGNSSEILQLALPERLLPPEKQTLWAKRDFKLINGTFVKCRITSVKYISASECVVSGDTQARVQVWGSSKKNADMLQKVDEIELKNVGPNSHVLLNVCSAHPTLLLSGSTSSLHSIQVHDLTTKQALFQLSPSLQHDDPTPCPPSGPLHSLTLEQPHLIVTCSGKQGQLDIWDFRNATSHPVASTNATPTTYFSDTPTEELYSLAVSDHSTQLAVLSTTRRLRLHDYRKLHPPLAGCCFSKESTMFSSRFSTDHSGPHPSPCVKYCPTSTHTLSVSGVDKGINVYDTSTWSCDISDPTPLFVHSGHEAECPNASVLVHSWQPRVGRNTILSVDSQASLHAWQWNKMPDKGCS